MADGVDPLVSVIVPVYNGAKYLAECLTSVFNQTWCDFEVIVVDDGSTDSSMEICSQFSNLHIVNQQNSGQSAARNRGVQEARGTYVAFIDQDDRWYPEKLARQMPVMRQGKYGMVYSNLDRIDDQGKIVERSFLDHVSIQPKRSIADCLAKDMFILPGTVVMERNLFNQAGGFDERLSGYEDDDLFLRIFQRARIFYIREPLMQWRIYRSSYSYTERMERSRGIYLRKLLDAFPDRPEENEFYSRDLIVPRFVRSYLFLYIQSLEFQSGQGTPERFREQLLSLPLQSSKLLSFIINLPIPVARWLQRLWRRTPEGWQRSWRKMVDRRLTP